MTLASGGALTPAADLHDRALRSAFAAFQDLKRRARDRGAYTWRAL